MLPQEATQPDEGAIRRDLEYMTARWGELPERGMFEIRAFKEGATPRIAKYSPDWIDDAVDFISDLNGLGYNIYAVRNPVREVTSGKGANDDDVIAAFFLWADCDDEIAASNVYRFDGPKWSAAVTTGRTPSVRVHTYWQLKEPCFDLAAWRNMQVAISRHFGSDGSVINPSRIMRVGGTVSYPDKKKQSRGYVKELTEVRTEYNEAREPVTLEQMARVFGQSQPASQGLSFGLQIDTGHAPALDRERAKIQALSGQDWHNAVIRLVASYVSKGLADDEIHALTDPLTLSGYTVDQTRAEVQKAIDGARAKGWTPDKTGQPAVEHPEAKQPPEPPFRPWKVIDPLSIPRREFIYGNHYIRKFASVTVAPGGLGKSTLVLAECIAIATGEPILGIQPKARERVVYYNAEDPLDEINRRVVAMCQHHQIDQAALEGWLYTASGRDADLILARGDAGDIVEPVFAMMEAYGAEYGPAVFVFDPLANMTESPETNDVFRRLGKRLSMMADKLNCSVEVVHHTRKLNGREAEIEDSRGGGALLGAVRAGRVLNPMTMDEAIRAGLETHIDHFRIEAAGKNNLARPSPHAVWYQRVSTELPNGDFVASVQPWQWPDAFEGVTADDARRVQMAVAAKEDNPPRENIQSSQWVGHLIADILGMDAEDKAHKQRIQSMVKAWVKSDVLEVVEQKDQRSGRDVKVVLCGSNNPAAETDS